MKTSLKFMIFSLVGFVVFLIMGMFIPVITLISSGFGLFAAISLIIFVFQSVTTCHHFLESSIGFAIYSAFSFSIMFVNELLGMKNKMDEAIYSILEQILRYSYILGLVFLGISLIILLIDLLFGIKPIGLTKERDIIPIKIFRVGIYWTYIVGALGAINVFSVKEVNMIAQIVTVVMFGFIIVMIAVLMALCTSCKIKLKLFLINALALFTSICTLLYFTMFDVISDFYFILGTTIVVIFNYICQGFTLLFIIQCMVYMVFYIFKPKGNDGIFSFFVPIIYCAIGLAISGLMYYDQYVNFVPYRMAEFDTLYYYAIVVFGVGVGVSFMSIAFKLIFSKKSKQEETEKIDLDNLGL